MQCHSCQILPIAPFPRHNDMCIYSHIFMPIHCTSENLLALPYKPSDDSDYFLLPNYIHEDVKLSK